MKQLTLAAFFYFFCFNAVAQPSLKEIKDLKTGRISYVDTSFVYQLPYEVGKSYRIVQGAMSSFSHKGEISLDFKMKIGSKICAARGGIVISARKDSKMGGLKEENLADGNYIIIKHDDGSEARYWHLAHNGVFVTVGQKVKQGDVIGLSGNTGYTAFPHLHFRVEDKNGKDRLVRFMTRKGPLYPRPGRRYTCAKAKY